VVELTSGVSVKPVPKIGTVSSFERFKFGTSVQSNGTYGR